MRKFKATESDTGQRLDVVVAQHLPSLTRSFVQKLCSENKVLVNEKPTRASYKLRPNDLIKVLYSELNDKQTKPLEDIPILYEDEDCIVIIKPVGILTHSKGAFNPEPTVASWLQKRTKGLVGDRAGIVHRLDRATSGAMIGAKDPVALKMLQKQFSERKVIKTYVAIVDGTLEPKEAILDLPIERNPKAPSTFRVGPNGKKAITQYRTIQTKNGYSLIELIPKSGRTHQLRVHLKYLKHPLVGDSLYGGSAADRLYLHALSLNILLPNNQRKSFTAPLPEEFMTFMQNGKL